MFPKELCDFGISYLTDINKEGCNTKLGGVLALRTARSHGDVGKRLLHIT